MGNCFCLDSTDQIVITSQPNQNKRPKNDATPGRRSGRSNNTSPHSKPNQNKRSDRSTNPPPHSKPTQNRGSSWDYIPPPHSKPTQNRGSSWDNNPPRHSKPTQNRGSSWDKTTNPNVDFYANSIPASPNRECIEQILSDWKRNYKILEENHNYIQWLFPNRKSGVNKHAFILKDEEAKIIRSTPVLKERVRRAFEMMLDFYGMRLTWNDQFELTVNSEQRLRELNQWGNHNLLRISRILLAIKELGHKDLMLPWLKFLADLIYKEGKLGKAQHSFEEFWIDTLDAEDRIKLKKYQQRYL